MNNELRSLGRACLPSIDVDGTVRLGETDTCARIGQVGDGVGQLEQRVISLGPKLAQGQGCNRCGLWSNMPLALVGLMGAGAAQTKRKQACTK